MEKILLNNEQWRNLIHEEYLEINENEEIDIEIIEREYSSSGRHTEYWYLIFKRLSDGKFFKVEYEQSVKDSMGWDECNWESETEAIEVFPKTMTITIYE